MGGDAGVRARLPSLSGERAPDAPADEQQSHEHDPEFRTRERRERVSGLQTPAESIGS